MTCCDKPNTASHDYEVRGETTINRMCLHCGKHWHGKEGAVREFSRKEWDDFVNEVNG